MSEGLLTKVADLIDAELRRARQKFPNNQHLMAALTEEVGELAQALLQHMHEDGREDAIRKEAIQVAAMAIRVLTEGDSTFEYVPPDDVRQS